MPTLRTKTLLLGGLVSLGIAAAPPTKSPVQPAAAVVAEPVVNRDPLAMLLTEGRAAHDRMRDYSCTFTRQERIKGVLSSEQVAEMKVRVQPFCISLRFASPVAMAGQEVSYYPRSDLKMKYRPTATSKVMLLPTDDSKYLAANRHPVTKMGIGSVLDTLSGVVARERTLNNPVDVAKSDYNFAGKPVTRYEIFTRRPHAQRAFYRAVVFVDKETKLLVRYEAYDQPKPGGSLTGELMEAYSFTDLRANTGLGESAFSN